MSPKQRRFLNLLSKLTLRDLTVMDMRNNGYDYSAISKFLKITTERIRQIERRVLNLAEKLL